MGRDESGQRVACGRILTHPGPHRYDDLRARAASLAASVAVRLFTQRFVAWALVTGWAACAMLGLCGGLPHDTEKD